MKRREALKAIGSTTIGAATSGSMASVGAAADRSSKSAFKPGTLGDSHFLAATNPIATADQRDIETLAQELLQTPLIRKAKTQASNRWKILAGANVPAEAMVNFDAMMKEWTLHYLLLALNSDPDYPKIVNNNFGPPHEWFGLKVPGNRCPGNGEAVDNNYSFFPIDGHARYELHGQRLSPTTGDCPIHVATNLSMSINVASLGLRDTKINSDGSFIVTIDSEPADGKRGRPNHLQTTIDSRYVYMRDARTDWRQVPTAFRVRRLDPPAAPPLTVEQKTAMAARFIVDDVGISFMYRQLVAFQDNNTVTAPEASTAFGGQASQRVARCHLKLADDEAFVLTLTPGGADYVSVIANTYWLTSLNYWDHSSSLNTSQSIANADGSFTYVISSRDPGIHNWIDTVGLHETLILLRWQLLPRNPDGSYGGSPWTRGQVVKLNDLDNILPSATMRVTPLERQQLLATRRAEFNLRFVDH